MVIPQFTVADRVRKARETAGLDQAVLAERLGVARNTLSRWETGASPLSQLALRAIAEETDVPLAWLLYGMTGAPTPTPIGARAGAPRSAKLPRLDSNQQPAD